jgi:predicted secreted Zn-dependent protease
MSISLTSVALAAALSVQVLAPPIAQPPAPPSAALVEAVDRVGVSELPNLTLTGYAVAGRSSRAIRESMDDKRPSEEVDGVRHDARTYWIYQTRWQNGADGHCVPATATVTLRLRMVLPDLTTRDQLSASEKADWDAYFAALVTHERNHARIAVAGRDQMQAAMRASPDCASMSKMIETTNEELKSASIEYDHQTDHGRREGAVYPRPGS